MKNQTRFYKQSFGVCGAGVVFAMAIVGDPASAQTSGRWTKPTEEEALLDEIFGQPVTNEFAEEVRGVISSLGVPSFKKREEATQRLTDLGPQAFLVLRDAYYSTDELEVRLRLENIFREGYLQHFVFGRNAFLGIQQGRQPRTHETDPRITAGFVGIVIGKIIEGTAAEAAGLQKDDVLIELDGEPIPDHSTQSNLSFGESIRVRGPGARVRLTLLRGTIDLTKDVVLRSRPRKYYRGRQGVVSQMLGFYGRTFDMFWEKHIKAPDPASTGDESS